MSRSALLFLHLPVVPNRPTNSPHRGTRVGHQFRILLLVRPRIEVQQFPIELFRQLDRFWCPVDGGSGKFRDPAGASRLHHFVITPNLRRQDAMAERREPIIAPPFVIQRWIGPLIRLLDHLRRE